MAHPKKLQLKLLFWCKPRYLRKAGNIGRRIVERTKGTAFVQNPMKTKASDIKIVINKDKAGMLGVPVFEIQKTIRMAMVGLSAGDFTDSDGKEYNISFTLAGKQKESC